MNAEERKKEIIALLKAKENRSVRIQELSKLLKVTRETIRKDLYNLAEEGLIKKTHGGAILESKNSETEYEKRREEAEEAKRKIAKAAVSYIEEGDIIYLDYGTTVFELAEEIVNLKKITVVTNSLPIINRLLENSSIEIVVLGGQVRRNEASLYGNFAKQNIRNIYVNIGFFGCSGIDVRAQITNHHIDESVISREMIKRSQTSILLADQSKFGNISLNQIANFKDIDTIITENAGKVAEEKEIIRQGGEIFYAD